jgi:hypothetical protein
MALPSTMRLRLAVFAAATVPSCLRLIRSSMRRTPGLDGARLLKG